MKDVLAPLYASLLIKIHARAQIEAREGNTSPQKSLQVLQIQQQQLHYKLLSLFPSPMPHDPWNNVVTGLFENLQNERLLYSEMGGGSFVSLKQAYVLQRNTPEDADALHERLETLLLQENLAVVRTPEVLLKTLVASKAVAGEVNPALVRGLFHVSKAHTHATLGVTNKPVAAALEHVLSPREMDCAVFWLQYCMRDITASTNGPVTSAVLEQLQQLLNLHLLPLENDTLGTLQATTDAPPYYLVNDTERRLLGRAGKHIVASEAVLGQHVYNILAQDVFAQVCNVRKITTIDTLKLITTVLPSSWMVASTVYANRASSSANVSGNASGKGNPATAAAGTEPDLIVSNEWLFSLWSYIVENKCMDMFREMFPILPVVYPNTLPAGQYLVKVSEKVPVLHMTYREIPADAVGLLAQLGVFVFDSTVLGGKSYSGEIVDLQTPPTARGVMDALALRVQALEKANADLDAVLNANPTARLALQSFVLDSVVSKIDTLTAADIAVLCALPIWSSFAQQPAQPRFGTLDTENMRLPPNGSNVADQAFLFDASFVSLRTERDRPLYLKLGVKEPSMGQFYATHIVPRFQSGAVPADKMDSLVVSILSNLPQLEKEQPGLIELLSACAIVRCEGEGDLLCAPRSLYDPQVPLLASFLPPRLFPSTTVYQDPALMHALRLLGLRTKVSAEDVLVSARAVQMEYDRFMQRSAPSESVEPIITRSNGLMTYLETHIDKVLADVSPATLEAFENDQRTQPQTPQQGAGTGTGLSQPSPGGQPSPQGGAWGQQLRSIAWVPVYVKPPTRLVHADLALPWPAKAHTAPVATPSQSTSNSNIWACSSTQRICSADTSKAALLEHVLGWDKPIPGRNIAGQLLALRQTHDTAVSKMSFSAHSANEIFAQVVPLLLDKLKQAHKRESPAEIRLWVDALRGKAIVWMQSRFIETSRLAFTPLPGVDTEPFLYVVRPEMQKYKRLLLELGARETFEAADLAALTRDLYAQSNGAQLTAYKTTLCIGIVQLLHKLISGEELGGVADEATPAATDEDAALPVATVVSEDGNTVPAADNSPTQADRKTAEKPKKVSVAELGLLYLPDELNYLQPATALTFDDAPWMSAAFHAQPAEQTSAPPSAAGVGGIRFVHGHVDVTIAAALGCKSLREQLFTGEDVRCPDAESLHYIVDEDGLRDTLIDLLYVADACGAEKLHFHYDGRTHPQESLLHPALAETQGPALMVYLEASSVVDRELMSILLTLQNLNNDVLQRGEAATPVSPGSSANATRARFRRATGKKLLSTFALTDCLQVLSGNEFFVFDPCGKYLLPTSAKTTTERNQQSPPERGIKRIQSKLQRRASIEATEGEPAQPRAQHYVINKTSRNGVSSSNALERFPDQFAPFFQLPYRFQEQLQRAGRVNGMVLRLPLRRASSAISRTVTTIDEVKAQFGGLRAVMCAGLVFADTLTEVTASHFSFPETEMATTTQRSAEKADSGNAAAEPAVDPRTNHADSQLDVAVKLISPSTSRRSRSSIVSDKGWNKSGFSKLFGKPFVPPEVMYTITLDTTLRCKDVWIVPTPQLVSLMTLLVSNSATIASAQSGSAGCLLTHREDWLLAAISGYGKLRDLALTEPYSALEMQPFVSAAVPILDSALLMDISVPPDAGMYFHSCAAVGSTGLPFHIEGSFLQVNDHPHLTRAASHGASHSLVRQSSANVSSTVDISVCQQWSEALMFIAIDILYPKLLFEIKSRIESVAKHLVQSSAAEARAGTTATAGAVVASASSGGSASRKMRLLSGFYKYFPYSPRTSSVALKVLNTTGVWTNFAQNPVFLQQSGFHYLNESMLPTKLLPSEVVAYVLPILPLAFCPQQLTADLTNARVGTVLSLSPAKLRQTMAHNALSHCSRLTNNGKLVRALLEYVLQDIVEKSAGEGEHTKRKMNREMAGVPLMCVATSNVKTFPRNASEQVAIAPSLLHALMPGLKNSFLHPTLVTDIPLFQDAFFLDTLFITAFNASFLERHIASVLPLAWRSVPAIEWVDSNVPVNAVGSAGRIARAAGDSSGAEQAPAQGAAAGPSPLLLYTLWNNVLSNETSWTEIERLREYPLVPVVSRGRRLLLSMALLSTVFSAEATEAQDAQRIHLKREAGRMASLAAQQTASAEVTPGVSVVDEWAWTTQPLSSAHTKTRAAPRPANAAGGRTTTAEGDSDDDIGDGVITDLDFPASPQPPARAVATAANTGPVPMQLPAAPAMAANVDGLPPVPPPDSPAAPATPTPASPSTSAGVLRILRTLGVPFLDTGVLEGVPQIINRSAGQGAESGGAMDYSGRRILQCLHRLDSQNIIVTPQASFAGAPPDNDAFAAPAPLLAYDDLTVSDRTTLLLLMANQQHQLMAPLSAQEQQQMKQLRLFTSKADGAAVSIAECRSGVYWCREESVLHTVRNRAAAVGDGAAQEAPVILMFDAALRDLYTLLGVEELTAATAVRKFTVPQLRSLEPLPRLRVMMGLAEQWDSYKGDQPLVDQLKEVPFIPVQSYSRGAAGIAAQSAAVSAPHLQSLEGCGYMELGDLRQAKDVFAWTNEELVSALRGSKQGSYFPPAYLRTAAMRAMCEDLGMLQELDPASFKRVATDIEATLNDAYTSNADSATQLEALREAAERGRALLRYVKASDRLSVLLQKREFAQSIGKIRFVPTRVPTATEAGGYVSYRDDVGRFDGLLARTHGALAFTVLPIIDEDIMPPQFFHSLVGITTNPSSEVVLRHVRNLTSHGESLDRWNAPYEITKTFSAIFQYLQDNWKTLSPNVKTSLSSINLVPVGNMLIKPTRLFFRLAEDLSPFMHEIPRLYGAHEAFLKQIGIKETPSVQDYVRFLSDLSNECGDCFLNPNELRAVVAILQVIAVQSAENADTSALPTPAASSADNASGKTTAVEYKTLNPNAADLSLLHVPDDRSVMRPIAQCLVNDNEWFRGSTAVQQQLRHSNLYMLHPSISASIAAQLHVERLSAVVVEELVTTDDSTETTTDSATLQSTYQAALVSPTFVDALSTLLLSKQAPEAGVVGPDGVVVAQRTPSALATQLQTVQIRLVPSLRTCFRLVYSTSSAADSAEERLSFLQQSTSGRATLFVNHSLATPPLSVGLAIAAGLCQLLTADLALSYAIAALLDAQQAAHTQLVLESLHVHLGATSRLVLVVIVVL
jgi:hypothetical protein